jgi:hypothetical protein
MDELELLFYTRQSATGHSSHSLLLMRAGWNVKFYKIWAELSGSKIQCRDFLPWQQFRLNSRLPREEFSTLQNAMSPVSYQLHAQRSLLVACLEFLADRWMAARLMAWKCTRAEYFRHRAKNLHRVFEPDVDIINTTEFCIYRSSLYI